MNKIAVALLSLLSVTGVAVALQDPARTCAARKQKAAGMKALAKIRCHAAATARGTTVDSACLARAEQRFAAAWARAESTGGCATSGDEGRIEADVDQFVAAVVVALPATTTTTSTTPCPTTTTTTIFRCGGPFNLCGGACPGARACATQPSGGCTCVDPPGACGAANAGLGCQEGVCSPGMHCATQLTNPPSGCGALQVCGCVAD